MKIYISNLGMPRMWLPPKILLIMKLIVVILFTCLMQVSASTLAQRITLSENNAPLEQVLNKIKAQSKMNILFSDDIFDQAKKVNIKLSNAPLKEVLDKLLENQSLSYELSDNTIVISKKAPSLLDKLSTVISNMVRDLNVKGRVVDQDGKPLPNASIRVKGKSVVTNTNAEGEFEIKNVADDAVLLVSYVGFRTLELPLKDAVMPLEIKLNVATGELEEVKVTYSTGYQTLNKERATGSFVQIDNNLINRSVSTNILDRIIGVSSGLNFEPNPKSGAGQNNRSNISIRGNSTIQANSNPLVVIDGFPYDESIVLSNVINNINPNDIESVTILKDAAAASIWGARSGNGVIVITTKKGKYGQKSRASFNSNFTIGNKPNLFYVKRISSAEAVEINRIKFADSIYNIYDDSYPSIKYFPSVSSGIELLLAARKGKISKDQLELKLAELEKIDVRDDIDKYLRQESVNQQYALNLSGGSNNFNYYGSIGYDRNRSTNVGDKLSRLTIRYENSYKLTKDLELNGYINYVQNKNINNGIGAVFGEPYSKLTDENGNSLSIPFGPLRKAYIDTASYPALLEWRYRPLDELTFNDNQTKQVDNRFGFGGKYQFFPGLHAELKYQYQKSTSSTINNYSKESYFVRNLVNQYMQRLSNGTINYLIPNGDILQQSIVELVSNNVRGQLNYNKVLGVNHALDAILGVDGREVTSTSFSDRKYGYDPINGVFSSNIDFLNRYPVRPEGNMSAIPSASSIGGTINRYISYFGNAAYTYKNRYTLSVSGRMDGSNFFGIKANQRITPLWSVGGLWDVTKENFYKTNLLSVLKIRATYGYNANLFNSVTAYPTILYSSGSTNFISQNTYARVTSSGNPELRWERVRMINIAVDFATSNSRIGGSIEYYNKKGFDLIGPIQLDPTTGFSELTGNRASIKGYGIDVVLNTLNTTGTVSWRSNFLLSFNTDRVVSYESKSQTASSFVTGQPYIGKPLYSIWSYRWAGLDPKNGNPRAYLSDTIASFNLVNTNAKPEDLVYNGTAVPRYFGSLRNTLTYRNLSLSFNILYKFDYFFKRNSIQYGGIEGLSGHSDFSKRWKKPGDELVTNVPSMSASVAGGRDFIYSQSNILVEKGDHIRLQDIRLDYTFSKKKLGRLPIQNVSLFIYANNLGILWSANDLGIDPEYGDSVIPSSRSLSIGLNVNF
ncbi:SusC/RagA family TonB-linked outer membrane protein [Pedobacter ginsengisoli]|uniref:SusC/RagA family TonB-linked outer membrane protein n=1 Tax=Pedobacter ginsengisoli TaxID=363852 RepID=UPI00254B0302|nr:SusC/RagA family TonB-linked outer membrane protein [Pedobacter ginsengisoli]